MAIAQIVRFIHQIWRKPSNNLSFPTRYKRLYRSFSFITILGVMGLLLSLNFLYPQTVDRWQLKVTAFMEPVLTPLHKVSLFFTKTIPDFVSRSYHMWNESAQVMQIQIRLEKVLFENQRLKTENARLREILHLPYEVVPPALTGEVFALVFDGFSSTLFLKTSGDQPFATDMSVVDDTGLVGRVISVSNQHARVMTIADPNLRVPVIVGQRGLNGIVAGDGPETMQFLYFEKPADLNIGDLVITSGQGGIFPQGIPVGVVTQIFPVVRLKTAATLKHLRFVKLFSAPIHRIQEDASE